MYCPRLGFPLQQFTSLWEQPGSIIFWFYFSFSWLSYACCLCCNRCYIFSVLLFVWNYRKIYLYGNYLKERPRMINRMNKRFYKPRFYDFLGWYIWFILYVLMCKLFYLKEKPSFSNISIHYFDLLQTLALKNCGEAWIGPVSALNLVSGKSSEGGLICTFFSPLTRTLNFLSVRSYTVTNS